MGRHLAGYSGACCPRGVELADGRKTRKVPRDAVRLAPPNQKALEVERLGPGREGLHAEDRRLGLRSQLPSPLESPHRALSPGRMGRVGLEPTTLRLRVSCSTN